MMPRYSLALALFVQIAARNPSQAATEPLYVPGTQNGTISMVHNESRQTLVKTLGEVDLTQLGAGLDPTGTDSFRWQIYLSDASGSLGPSVYDVQVLFPDLGSGNYNTAISIHFGANTYLIVELQNTSGSATSMARYPKDTQGLPFVTGGGNFQVLDGAANYSFADPNLPSFSISATPVPEPETAVLLALGSIGLASARRRSS